MSGQIRFPIQMGSPAVRGMEMGEGGQDLSIGAEVDSVLPPALFLQGWTMGFAESPWLGDAGVFYEPWQGQNQGEGLSGSVNPPSTEKACSHLWALSSPGQSWQKIVDQALGVFDGGVRQGHSFPVALEEALSAALSGRKICVYKSCCEALQWYF